MARKFAVPHASSLALSSYAVRSLQTPMRYLGGKSRIARKLAARIREIVPDAEVYWDPFCGGLSMSVALSKYAPVLASDACAPLIALYKAVRAGWVPPSAVSEDEWRAAKFLPDTNPLKAFCGFACSFGAKWFGGYDAEPRRKQYTKRGQPTKSMWADPARAGAARLPDDVATLSDIECIDWLEWPAVDFGGVLYLDPPYAGTTGYDAVGLFDSRAFIGRVRAWSEHAHVFVSEYDFSLGECVWKATGGSRGVGTRASDERLYYVAKGSL